MPDTLQLEPGVYEGMPFDEYCAIEAVNNSRLKGMEESPRHYIEPFRISAPSLAFGNLAHCGRLEPNALAERYAVASDWHLDEANTNDKGQSSTSKATRYYKDKLAEFAAANIGKEIVSADDYRRMQKLVESIDADPESRRLFEEIGPTEVTIVWDDPETGIRCKGRIDKVGIGRTGDLKTTGKPLSDFTRSIKRYAYHRQQAFYRFGWAVLNGGELLEPWICAVESESPHCVQSAPMDEMAIYQGDVEWRRLLNRVAECHESGCWPGPSAPESWELPSWAVEPVTLSIGGEPVEVAR